jgi:mitochondrial fission protein ELM1
VLISTGRTSILASVYVKHASGGRTFTVQIQKSGHSPVHFDCVIAPAHDRLHGDNVISMVGSLHRVTPQLLHIEAERWRPRVEHLPRPYVTVLIGGPRTAVSPLRQFMSYKLGPDETRQIAHQLAKLATTRKATLLIAPSRRTGVSSLKQLRAALAGCPAIVFEREEDNPYYGLLGLADSFIVTCDSATMISEACSTGKPVQMIRLPGRSPKFEAFHRSLIATNRLRYFNGELEDWHYEPLREKERVAALVRRAYTEQIIHEYEGPDQPAQRLASKRTAS